jgi:hypothetical protein
MQRWIIIHWFELGVLGLPILNLWFVYVVLKTLRSGKRGPYRFPFAGWRRRGAGFSAKS